MSSPRNLRTRTQLLRLKQIMEERQMVETKTPWWKKLLKVVFSAVVTIAVEEVGKRLEDKQDPYPKPE
jgi:hypothetical protein